MGYDKAYSMLWGMCSWDSTFMGPWQSNMTNTYATQFTSDATAKGEVGELPVLSTGKESGQDILEARVNYLLTNENEGFGGASISNSVVFDNLDNYYIINYWPEADYTGIGHIPGATQYTPKESIKLSTDLKTIPTDKTVVVYCYTGQTSAFLTAYLRLIGYDAKSLKFGTNGMIYDEMTAHKFSADAVMGYPFVVE
ncbi:MAG: rhodanese-like domain-containing protein [Chlorobi bacterium]|nr:rhodanese-like domain-containing protein [Chlorobiota bacterium]